MSDTRDKRLNLVNYYKLSLVKMENDNLKYFAIVVRVLRCYLLFSIVERVNTPLSLDSELNAI